MARKKLVILVAPTGGNAMDREGAHVPLSPEEIADEGVRCLEAGASVLHIHARDPVSKQGSADPAISWASRIASARIWSCATSPSARPMGSASAPQAATRKSAHTSAG